MNAIQNAALGELCRILKAWKRRVDPLDAESIRVLGEAATMYLAHAQEQLMAGDSKLGIHEMMVNAQEVVDFITNSPRPTRTNPSLN